MLEMALQLHVTLWTILFLDNRGHLAFALPFFDTTNADHCGSDSIFGSIALPVQSWFKESSAGLTAQSNPKS